VYLPAHFRLEDLDSVAALVDLVGSADLVTVAASGEPASTLVPVLWDRSGSDPEAGRHGRLLAHVATINPQWAEVVDGQRVLAIVHGAQAYISPAWYASKAEHGRVVPTWNYSSVHLSGTVELVDDPDELRDLVGWLTDHHEHERPDPWSVDDAPAAFITGQLRAIRGVIVHLDRVEAKAKLSQNRSLADRVGVVSGLLAEGGGPEVADAMASMIRDDTADDE
jgi:transcriptional regulator